MERLKSFVPTISLPRVRFPTFSQLKDGSFFTQYNGKEERRLSEKTWLQEFESKLVAAQEVAVWSNPGKSVIWLLLTQVVLYYLLTTSTPILSTLAYFLLSTYVYITWVYTVWPAIRVPPQHPEDDENWTPVHPDVLSAPEMSKFISDIKRKTSELSSGMVLLRKEQPGKFCLVFSLLFTVLAVIGTKCSTPVILHTSAFLALVLPAMILRLSKHPTVGPVVVFLGDFIGGLLDILIYRGLHAPPRENRDLDDFVPEVNQETNTFLEKALSYVQKKETDEQEMSLASGLAIPSHEEVELDSLNTQDLEADLFPTSALAIEQGGDQDSSDSEVGSPIEDLRDFNDSDTDDESLQLNLEVRTRERTPAGGVLGMMAETVTSSVTTGLVSSATSSVSQLLGNLLKTESEPDIDDFEMISEDELSLENH